MGTTFCATFCATFRATSRATLVGGLGIRLGAYYFSHHRRTWKTARSEEP